MSDRKTISESTANDKTTCVVTLDEQITRYARRIAAQVCGGFADNTSDGVIVGGVVDALIIQEAVRRRLTDNDMKEESVFCATVENREKLRKRDLNADVHGKKVVE